MNPTHSTSAGSETSDKVKAQIISEIRWTHDMSFVAVADSGHAVSMDTVEKSGGHNTASTPKELLLDALGGCTGMDVISILRKMRLEPSSFVISVQGEMEPVPPRAFESLHLEYRFEGESLPLESLEKAVALSQEKYCSVSHMLRRACPLTWSIVVNGAEKSRSGADLPPLMPPD